MSEAGKLSCPFSVLELMDGMPVIQDILNDVDKSDDHTILHKLATLLNMLTTADASKDFEAFEGPSKILRLIDSKNRKITKLTFLILGQYLSKTDQGINSKLLSMHVFGTLSKTLEDIDSLSYNFAQSALFLLSSIVSLDKMGQMLVRKSKCLHHLIVLFLRILSSLIRNEHWEEERAIRESKGHCETWKVLCLSIKKSIYDPQNKTNQQQVNTIIPKSIIFLGDWVHYEKENDPLEEFVLTLISLLVQVLFHNQMNQTSFAAYSGISIVIRGLKKFQGLQYSFSGEITNKMIRLLNAAISGHKENCLVTISLGGMDLLLQLLKMLPDDKKFAVIVTLTHLVQRGDENDEKFVKEEGLSTLAVATVNVGKDPTERQAASKLLKSWSSKISLYNNQQKKCIKNDQPFRDNSLLKFKTSLVSDHQEFHDECLIEAFHIGDQENFSASLKEVRQACVGNQGAQLTKQSDVTDKEVLITHCNEFGAHKMQKEQLALKSVSRSIPNPSESQPIDTAQNKIEENALNLINFGDTVEHSKTIHLETIKETENKAGPTLQKNEDDCNLLKPMFTWEINEKNCQEPNTTECINRKLGQSQMSPISTQTTCLNDISLLCSNDGFADQDGQHANISSLFSENKKLQEYKGTQGSPWLNNEALNRENLNESSESEYASALDISFGSDPSFSSCNAVCKASTKNINDVTTNKRDNFIYSSSGESMETQCLSEDIMTQNLSEQSLHNSSNSSESSSIDEQTETYKRSRESYERFTRKIRSRSGSDFECRPVRHSTPRTKKPKLGKKFSTGNSSKQRILSYQNISVPSSNAGFSAVKLNSSISSSNKSSLLQLSREELGYLEVGAARFGKNFKALMENSFSTTQ